MAGREIPMQDQRVIKTSQENFQRLETAIAYGHGQTILLADGNSALRRLGQQVLERLNYKVLTAADGFEVVEYYRQSKQKIDLLILDVAMPKLTGAEILIKVRQFLPSAKVLLCTVSESLSATEWQSKIGAEPIINKPYAIADLSQKVQEAFSRAMVVH